MRRALVSGGIAAALVASMGAVPAHASSDSCTLGSPNIVRDVTECVYTVLGNCPIGGSPNILTDVMECLR